MKGNETAKIRILVVDDDPLIRGLLYDFLAEKGYEVEKAADGVQAEEILLEKKMDLVLTDLLLPGPSGLDLAKKIRFLYPECRIILITGNPQDADIVQCITQNVSRYLCKPFPFDTIVRTIEEVLSEQDPQPFHAVDQNVGGWLEMDLKATEDALIRAHHYMEHYLLEHLTQAETAKRLAWSFYEMVRNAMEWGNRLDENTLVRVGCLALSDRVLFKVQDQGSGFDVKAAFQQVEDPFLRQHLRKEAGKRPGGYGIEITRKYMDDLFYNEKGNCLIMTKYVRPPVTPRR